MSAPTAPSESRRPSIADATVATETELRQTGQDFLVAFYAALRSLELYPLENEQAQKSLDELTRSASVVIDRESELEVRISGQLLFVNSTRLRLDHKNYASSTHVINTLRRLEVGALNAIHGVDRKQWQVFISVLLSFATRNCSPNIFAELKGKMVHAHISHISVEPPSGGSGEIQDEELEKDAAKRTYERSVAITRELAESTRMGRSASVKEVKRAVQGIVDQVLNNELTLIGLTTIRDYDDYTFTHSVNVCLFSVAIGKRLGLSKTQLYDLGMAAFLHDVGKSRMPKEIVAKTSKLTEDEWGTMRRHPLLGAITLFGFRGYGEIPYRSMITAYEHHMKKDLTGYPRVLRSRELSIFSKIVMVADTFDADTSRRVYRIGNALLPNEILQELLDEHARLGIDLVIVKALINLLGIYPVGSCVILDNRAIAIVQGANPNENQLNRPLVRIVYAADDTRVDDAPVVDLAETNDDGSYKRTIIKVTDPEKYELNPGDYCL